MKFSSILGNSQKLDGGSMFGNAPKALWERWIKPDGKNRIPLATRALLTETKNHKILFETGIGSFMDPKLSERFGIENKNHVLLNSLKKLDLTHEDITEVILSHLHFDHAGGLLSSWQEDADPELLFPNATIYTSEKAWARARSPHQRDRASFIPSLNRLLEDSGRLVVLNEKNILYFDDLEIHFFHSDGHTPGMICSDLRWGNSRLIFAGDLIPGIPWVHIPITMGYDRYPEKLIDEKQTVLESVVKDNAWVFFTHDMQVIVSKIKFDDQRKKYIPSDQLRHFELKYL